MQSSDFLLKPSNLVREQREKRQMTSKERFQARMNLESVDRIPNFNIMMTFAAHYIEQPLSRYYQDYKVLCDANFAVQNDFTLDILQAISDPYREAADLGLLVEFPHDSLPVRKEALLKEYDDLLRLKPISPEHGKRMSDRLEAIARFNGHDIPVMGWVEGALAQAATLRGVDQLLMDLYLNPQWVNELLEFCVELEIEFAIQQIKAGADIIGLGDAVASQISASMYSEFCLPFEKRIFQGVLDHGAVPRLHICGDTSHILQEMTQSKARIIDIDWMVDMERAAGIFAKNMCWVCGNFDPVQIMLKGSPETVYQAVRDCARAGSARSLIMAGCEIPDGTPHQNLLAMADALKDFQV
ncbi:uroporphyrinogen decarboxylase [candidate division KSB1 bacterium]|nr:uroporphyrinogen decarboxylase [candidate division KSB1 bacterium]